MKRIFSKPEDRLIAIAGVARAVQHSYYGQYLAGLWQRDIHYGLYWIIYGQEPSTRIPRRPTWTWASYDDHMKNAEEIFPKDPTLKFRRSDLKYVRGAFGQFGHVTGGSIKLTGLLGVFPLGHPQMDSENYSRRLFIADSNGEVLDSVFCLDTTKWFPKGGQCYALILGFDPEIRPHARREFVLLLQKIRNQQASFVRMGAGFINFHSADTFQDGDEMKSRAEQLRSVGFRKHTFRLF